MSSYFCGFLGIFHVNIDLPLLLTFCTPACWVFEAEKIDVETFRHNVAQLHVDTDLDDVPNEATELLISESFHTNNNKKMMKITAMMVVRLFFGPLWARRVIKPILVGPKVDKSCTH